MTSQTKLGYTLNFSNVSTIRIFINDYSVKLSVRKIFIFHKNDVIHDIIPKNIIAWEFLVFPKILLQCLVFKANIQKGFSRCKPKDQLTLQGEWLSGLYSLRQVTEVKLGRVRSDFGWVTSED